MYQTRQMYNIVAFAIISLSLLLMASSAQDQPNSGLPYMDGQYPSPQYPPNQQILNGQYPGSVPNGEIGGIQQNTEYSTSVPSGAPVPVAPNNPGNLGLQIPSEQTTSVQAPPSGETGQALIPADESAALGSTNGIGDGLARSTYSAAMSMMVVPPGIGAPNKLYASFVPQTIGGCYLNGWLSMWLQTSRSSPIWFYEWYPDGRLDVNYLGYSYPGWQKRWFYGDTPGWHVLQYYSQGWSNYVYIYVYGWGGPNRWYVSGPSPDAWLNPDPYWSDSGMVSRSSITTSRVTRTSNDGRIGNGINHWGNGDSLRKHGKPEDHLTSTSFPTTKRTDIGESQE